MSKTDLIVLAIIVLLLAAAVFYIQKSRKAGKRCAGCPDSGNCPGCRLEKNSGEKQ